MPSLWNFSLWPSSSRSNGDQDPPPNNAPDGGGSRPFGFGTMRTNRRSVGYQGGRIVGSDDESSASGSSTSGGYRRGRPRVRTTSSRSATSSEAQRRREVHDEQKRQRRLEKQRRRALLESFKRDRELTQEMKHRWCPEILPTDPRFTKMIREFGELLREPSTTINDILETKFAPPERELLIPMDRRSNPALATIQQQNRRRYRDLLRSARFKDWAPRADLAFKFTLAYFGLPVEPMTLDFPQRATGWDQDDRHSDDDFDEPLLADRANPDIGNLRFLNGYNVRVFEKDSLRTPDKQLEAYYAFEGMRAGPRGRRDSEEFLGLRGGEIVTDDEDEDDQETESLVELDSGLDSEFDSQGSVEELPPRGTAKAVQTRSGRQPAPAGRPTTARGRGGAVRPPAIGDTAVRPKPEAHMAWVTEPGAQGFQTPLHGESGGADGRWIPLYGFQGVVWFQADALYTFVDAVDRLLCLDTRAGVTYKLYLLDKKTDYSKPGERTKANRDRNQTITVWCKGVGDYGNDHVAWEWILDKYANDLLGKSESPKVLFLGGPGDPFPIEWMPNDSHGVLELALAWDNDKTLNRPDVAYLRMPTNHRDVLCTNQFGPWISHASRVLAAGRLPDRPGRPPIPDAFITLKSLRNSLGSYGGLAFPPQLWYHIVASWEAQNKMKGGSKRVELLAKSPQVKKGRSDAFLVFLPGQSLYSDARVQYIEHDEFRDVESVRNTILNLVIESLGENNHDLIHSVEVHLPGESFFVPFVPQKDSAAIVIPVEALFADRGEAEAFKPLVVRLVQWKLWLEKKAPGGKFGDGLSVFPQFIAIRPVFHKYTVTNGAKSLEWKKNLTSLSQFKLLARSLWPKGALGEGDFNFVMTQGRQIKNIDAEIDRTTKRNDDGPVSSKPLFVVTAETQEAEWEIIRKLIVHPKVYIHHLAGRDLEPVFTPDQVFGYRDIYRTRKQSLVYGQPGLSEDMYPPFTHYHDWQLWGENINEHYQTLQPWDEQGNADAEIEALGVESRLVGKKRGPRMSVFSPSPPPERTSRVPLPIRGGGGRGGPAGLARYAAAVSDDDGPANPPERFGTANPPERLGTANPLERLGTANPPEKSARRPKQRPLGDMEKAQRLRELSYAHPLNVQMNQSIPINAPPVDSLLHLDHDSLPVVSLAVLTPTEIHRLQKDYFELRSILLGRSQRCPYAGCGAIFPVNRPAEMQRHLRNRHTAEKCNFCDEVLYEHWPLEQRYEHFVLEHEEILGYLKVGIPDQQVDLRVPKLAPGHERHWNYCARCGRDHHTLKARGDRAYHDFVCHPGVGDRPDWKPCHDCGKHITVGREADHEHLAPLQGSPYCDKCGLPLGLFSEGYQMKHRVFCRGYGADDAGHCPWCDIELEGGILERGEHIEDCSSRPNDDFVGPIDLETLTYFPQRKARKRREAEAEEEEGEGEGEGEGEAFEEAVEEAIEEEIEEERQARGKRRQAPAKAAEDAPPPRKRRKAAPSVSPEESDSRALTYEERVARRRRRRILDPSYRYRPEEDVDDSEGSASEEGILGPRRDVAQAQALAQAQVQARIQAQAAQGQGMEQAQAHALAQAQARHQAAQASPDAVPAAPPPTPATAGLPAKTVKRRRVAKEPPPPPPTPGPKPGATVRTPAPHARRGVARK
ncbi:hypothetical protein B0T24DRAFT_232909 [Lasiosphaeria ovina]|uniref:Uncharacterized protein n=1 Tax=Lasiosphaeria ovina TaxID=92902 RepID=A0AAE0KIN7_9PEZI|nr:hypothetical protein B0T24DRAFT_232909 [Lasiosphaeria ovina]